MPALSNLSGSALLTLGLAPRPGPNMMHSVSRSISQGRAAGLISLCSVGWLRPAASISDGSLRSTRIGVAILIITRNARECGNIDGGHGSAG